MKHYAGRTVMSEVSKENARAVPKQRAVPLEVNA